MIYFIRPLDDAPFKIGHVLVIEGRPIKIGYSFDPWKRLISLREKCRRKDMEIIGVLPGGVIAERAIHRTFAKSRIDIQKQGFGKGDVSKCEWFNVTDRLLNFIAKRTMPFQPGIELPTTFKLKVPDRYAMLVEQAALRGGLTPQEFIRDVVARHLMANSESTFPFRNVFIK